MLLPELRESLAAEWVIAEALLYPLFRFLRNIS